MRIFSNPATPLHSKRTRFSPLSKIPSKVVHTTCLLLQNKISYPFPGVVQLIERAVWDFISAYPLCFSQSAETLGTLRKARFSCSRKIPAKVVHTTGLLLQNKISYSSPGVAQLVARVVWDHQAAGSNPVTRTKTPLKPLVSGEFFLILCLFRGRIYVS